MRPFAELTIDQMMEDPIVLALMKADDVGWSELQSVLHSARNAIAGAGGSSAITERKRSHLSLRQDD